MCWDHGFMFDFYFFYIFHFCNEDTQQRKNEEKTAENFLEDVVFIILATIPRL